MSFFAFICPSERLSSSFFCSVFPPFSKVRNSELHSTFFVYFSFYGTINISYLETKEQE